MGKDKMNKEIAVADRVKSPMEISDQKMSNLPHNPKYNSS